MIEALTEIASLGLSFCCGEVATTEASRIKDRANAHSGLKDRATVPGFGVAQCFETSPRAIASASEKALNASFTPDVDPQRGVE